MEDSKTELPKAIEFPKAIDTRGGVEKYARCFQMTVPEMADLIKDKTILDLGSGIGGFAKEVAIKNIPTKVYSVNPKAILETTKERDVEYTSNLVKDSSDIDRVQKAYSESLTSAFGEYLPFKEESFDIVFDVMALTHYSNDENFRKAANEMYRVVKKGGQILIYADFGAEFDNERRYKDRALTLKELGIPYKEVRHDGYGIPEGFRITKPEA